MPDDISTIPTRATRVILALVDEDTTAAMAAITETGDDPEALRHLALALGQFCANRTTPDDAAKLVQLAMDRRGGDA